MDIEHKLDDKMVEDYFNDKGLSFMDNHNNVYELRFHWNQSKCNWIASLVGEFNSFETNPIELQERINNGQLTETL